MSLILLKTLHYLAILFAGGWEGHSPIAFSNWCKELLEKNEFEVEVYETLAPLENPEKLEDVAKCCKSFTEFSQNFHRIFTDFSQSKLNFAKSCRF